MLTKGTVLTANNLNNAFISKTDSNAQSLASSLILSGGSLTLKNSVVTDNASATYMRIDPQGNQLIIYDGVNNQRLDVYSSSGSESTYIQTINGTTSFGQIDVSNAVDHLEINTNTSKRVDFGGKIQILNGNDLVFRAGSIPNDAGDIVFQSSGGTELARIYSSSGGVLHLSTGTNLDPQMTISDSAITLNNPTTVSGKITANSGIGISGSNALSFDTFGGGFNMTDTTWIRTTGSKSFYHDSGLLRTDGTFQIGINGATLSVPNNGALNYMNGKFVVATGGAITTTGPINMTTSKNGSGKGINLDGVTIDTVNSGGAIAIGGLKQLRFSDNTSYDWNVWAGIKYDSTNLKLYIGGPASSQFDSNASPPVIDVVFDGINSLTSNGHLYMGSNKNFTIEGGSINQRTPSTGGWARGTYWQSSGGATTYGGVGIYGDTTTVNNIYIGHGSSPWSTTKGIIILETGNVGIGTTSPNYKLDVNGTLNATGLITSTVSNAPAFKIADDAQIWDINVTNTLGIKGVQNASLGYIRFGNDAKSFGFDGTNLVYNGKIVENTTDSQTKATTAQTNAIDFAKGYGLGDYAKMLASFTDFNTVQLSGFYRVNAGVNCPPRVAGDNTSIWHYLLVIGHDTTWTSQIAIEYATGTMFTRVKNGSVWTAWTTIETTSGAQTKADNTRKDGTKTMIVEVRTSDPSSPSVGQIWLRSDL